MKKIIIPLLGLFSGLFAGDLCHRTPSFNISVDYLYLQPEVRLPWVATFVQPNQNDPSEPSILIGTTSLVRFDFDSGFRATLGAALPCSSTYLKANWTHFQTSKKLNAFGSSESDTQVTPAFAFSLPNGVRSSTLLFQERLSYNDFQLFLCYESCLGSLKISPQGGLKALFIHQNVHSDYFGTTKGTSSMPPEFFQTLDYPNRYYGVGIVAGVGTKWDLFCNIALVGDLSTSLLAGTHTVQFISNIPDIPPSVTVKRRFNELVYTFDLSLGFSWSTTFFCDRVALSLVAGWEGHYISDQTKYPDIQSFFSINSEPLTLQGLKVGVNISL